MVKEGYKEVRIGPKKVELPINWETSKIKELLKIKSGYAFKSNDYVEDGVFMVRVTNINDNGEIKKENGETKYLPEEYLEKYKKYQLEDNDILLVMVGASTGKIGKVKSDVLPAILNQNMWNLKPKDDSLDKPYFYYSISKEINRFLSMKIGSARSYIKKGDFKKFEIPLPPLPEQKKIASILSSVDKSIEKTSEIIEETKELKKGLMQELLTKGIGHSEFKEVNINGKTMELPLNWEIKMLTNVTQINKNNISTSTPEDYEIEYIDISSINDIGKIEETAHYNYGNAPSRAKRLVNIDDVIVSTVRPYLKSFSIIKEDKENLVCSTGFAVLTPKFNMETEYIYYFVWSNHFVNYMKRLMRGTSYPAVNKNDVANTFIPVPPLEEQKKIASILSSVDKKIKKEEEYKAKLERLKKGLMQKLLTGEIRVNTDMEV
jgi:type I restriction enzyme S subunit